MCLRFSLLAVEIRPSESGSRALPLAPGTASLECDLLQAILEETHTRTVRSCAWSPSEKLLATTSFDAITAIWENFGGDFECVSTLEGHENEVKSVSWNASGSLLATCGSDGQRMMMVTGAVCRLEVNLATVAFAPRHPHVRDGVWDIGGMWWPLAHAPVTKVGRSDRDQMVHLSKVDVSDDLTLKIWEADIPRMQSGDGYAPW
ncbi:hypothetical protein V6N11_066151 [Hibiscus sabdariffa]|uniref:Uncharacterized protein n=2 Tax=Hibiscus sabdariffa TaxID=183260 RepID=A0ABR2B0V4_9ROSI